MARDDFSEETKRRLGERVCLICSNPECRAPTKGPHTDDDKAASIGKACHIHAAAEGGPRYDANQTPEERASIRNGIWLCSNCATRIDNDWQRYPAELLRAWKAQAERRAGENMGKPAGGSGDVERRDEVGITTLFTFELERLRETAAQRGTAACSGPWMALTGAAYDDSQLKQHLKPILDLLARDPSAGALLRELLVLVSTADAMALAAAAGPLDQVQLRDLRHATAEAAQKIHLKATALLACVSPQAEAAATPAFVAMLEEQEQRTQYMQQVFWRMNHGPKVTFHRSAGKPLRVGFEGKFFEVPQLLDLLHTIVRDASSDDDEFAFWSLLNAARNVMRATWDALKDPSCTWSKEEWLALAERFAELEQAHGETAHRFWDEGGEVKVFDEQGEFLGMATYMPPGKNGLSDPLEGLLMGAPSSVTNGRRYSIEINGRRVSFIADRSAGGDAFVMIFR